MPDINNLDYSPSPIYEVPQNEAQIQANRFDFISGDSPDTNLPVITIVSPIIGSTILKSTSLVIDVTDNLGLLVDVSISAELTSLPAEESVYSNSTFSNAYNASVRVGITNGFRFTINRNVGWPSSPTVKIVAIDTAGNKATGSYSWVITGADSPTVTVISPTVGSTITPTTPVVADVVDNIALRRVMLFASFEDYKVKEVIFDGSTFSSNYTLSSRIPITGGYQYTLLRDDGWPSEFTLTVNAIDTTGNEA